MAASEVGTDGHSALTEAAMPDRQAQPGHLLGDGPRDHGCPPQPPLGVLTTPGTAEAAGLHQVLTESLQCGALRTERASPSPMTS